MAWNLTLHSYFPDSGSSSSSSSGDEDSDGGERKKFAADLKTALHMSAAEHAATLGQVQNNPDASSSNVPEKPSEMAPHPPVKRKGEMELSVFVGLSWFLMAVTL